MRNNVLILKIFYFFLVIYLMPLSLLAQWGTNVSINSGNPAFPFPQFNEYTQGKSLAKYNPVGVTHAEMEKTIREGYQIMMNRSQYTGDQLNGTKYITYNNMDCNYGTFVSEGDGYALLAAAYMADKPTFDGLWLWVHDNRLSGDVTRYLDCKPLRPGYGYGNWVTGWQNDASTPNGSSNDDDATDGDVDIALALLVAYRQWGEFMGINDACGNPISYKEAATRYIAGLVDTVYFDDNSGGGMYSGTSGYYTGDIGIDGYVKNGNTWSEMTSWGNRSAGNMPLEIRTALQGPQGNTYFDYFAPAYFHAFADFLKSIDPVNYQWHVDQYLRAEASSDWLMGKLNADGYFPQSGKVSVNADGSSISFGNVEPAEDFRLPLRTIINYMWHGPPTTTWNPVTHQPEPGTNTFEYDNALDMAAFVKSPSNGCEKLGTDPVQGITFNGTSVLRSAYTITGSPQDSYYLQWTPAAATGSAVLAEDTSLAAHLYRDIELEWDVCTFDSTDYGRYLGSVPKYFHGWFRVYGLLVVTGNFHSPVDLVNPQANMKVYVDVDKTFGFRNDEVTYTIDYRNFASVDASGVQVVFNVPSGFDFVSAQNGGAYDPGSHTVTWNIGSVSGFKTGGLAATMDSVKVVTRIAADSGRFCASAEVSAANGTGWMSNEYPNVVSPTMKYNCVDVVDRALLITKTADRTKVNPGDTILYKINFENSSKAGFLNGGRPGIRLTYAYGYAGPNTFNPYFRLFHGAEEAYINYGDYRASYYINDPTVKGLYPTDPNGWNFSVNIFEGGNPADVSFDFQQIPYGSDTNGKWNQRLIVRFANSLAATTQHLYKYFGVPGRVHKGNTQPMRAGLKLETVPSTAMAPRNADDWSYTSDSRFDVGSDDKSLFFPITPNWADPNNPGVPVTKAHVEACETQSLTFARILIEEFDGYTWRRILGNGPLPGREAYNVVVVDTLPASLKWVGFEMDSTLGIKASYNASKRTVTWTIPVLLVGSLGTLAYKTVANGTCPQSDKVVSGTAWIYASAESQLGSTASVTITCKELPPPPPQATTMAKTADKPGYKPGDTVTYTIDFEQTLGTIANPSLDTTKDWTAQAGTILPNFSDFSSPWNTRPKLFTYDYSHGTNGILVADIKQQDWQDFALVFRYKSGHPKDGNADAVFLWLKVNPSGAGTIEMQAYNGQSPVSELYNSGYTAPYDHVLLKVVLDSNDMKVWVNDTTGPAVYETTGITKIQPGYVGIYDGNPTGVAPENGQNALLSWWTNFDSAFDVSINDVVPTGVAVNNSSLSAASLTSGVITWSLISGKTPMLYGTKDTVTWTGNVDTCSSAYITNIAYTNMLGQPKNKIGAQSVTTCNGILSACTPPTQADLVASKTSICQGDTVSMTVTTDAKTGYIYTWYKNSITPANIVAGPTADLKTFMSDTASSGSYFVIIADNTDPTNNACQKTSNKVTLTVNPKVTPGVIDSNQTICAGAKPALFNSVSSATGNAGYQWQSGSTTTSFSNITGATAATYQEPSTLTDSMYYRRVAKATGGVCPDAYSDTIKVAIRPVVSASVTINNPGPVCSNQNVTFTATPSGGGSSPTYQWLNGGTPVSGETNPTYTPSSLTNGEQISVVMTSSAPCVTGSPDTSNIVTMSVSSTVTASVTIGDPGYVCSGDTVILTTTSSGGGSTPSFQWYKGGSPISGATSSTYNSTSLVNGDQISVVMTSSSSCATGSPATSNVITMSVSPSVTASVTINDPGAICFGQNVTFHASASDSGSSPTYQWYKGAAPISGATDSTYSSSALANGDQIYVIMKSNAPCVTNPVDTSNVDIMSVSAAVNPTVTITASDTSICQGDTVTFTATSSGGGTSPTYQWWINGSKVGTNSTGFITSILTNHDTVKVVMVSSSSCATTDTVTSNAVVMTVKSSTVASVQVTASDTAICSGESVAFTAVPANGGTPSYQWWLNGAKVGSNSASYASSSLGDKDTVKVVMTSTQACVTGSPATSNAIVMTVKSSITPSVTIAASDTAICQGDTVTFTATPAGGGSSPAYQWMKNSSAVGADTSVFTTTAISDKDTIEVTMTSNSSCASGGPVTSNKVVMTLNTPVTASVSIAANPASGKICQGDTVTFTATPTNGGSSPVYQWLQNQTKVGSNFQTFKTAAINDQDTFRVVMTSSLTCVTASPAISDSVIISVQPKVTPSVTVTADQTTICPSDTVTVTAHPVNGGIGPTFQWFVNSGLVGPDNAVYPITGLTAGTNKIYVVMVSDASCVNGAPARNSDTVSVSVQSSVAPAVTIRDPGPLCSGQSSVSFGIQSSSGGGATPTYQWLLNGSPVASDTVYNPNPASLSNGSKVGLIMTSSSGCASPGTAADSVTVSIQSTVTPTVSITASPSGAVCQGAPVSFSIASQSGQGTKPAYQWMKNGVALAGDTNTVFSSSSLSNGDTIRLRLVSDIACASPDTVYSSGNIVSVSAIPNAVVTASDTVFCPGGSVVLMASSSSGTQPFSYRWFKNAAVTPATSNADTVSVAGSYSVEITSADNCKDTSTQVSVSQISLPSVNISPASKTLCSGDSVTLTSSETNPAFTYQWFNGSTLLTASGSTYKASSAGSYKVVVSLSGCSDTSSIATVTVNNPTTPVITGNSAPACQKSGVAYSVSGANAGSTYNWQVPAGASVASGQGTGSITVDFGSVSGNITVTETTSSGCTSPQGMFSIALEGCGLVPDFSASSTSTCPGSTITFTNMTQGASPAATYQWSFPGGNPSSSTNTDTVKVIYSNPGTYDVTLAVTDGVSKDTTKTGYIQVITPASVSAISGPGSVCAGNQGTFSASQGSGSYNWSVTGGTLVDGQGTNTIHAAFSQSGNAIVSLIYTSTCNTSDTASKSVTVAPAASVKITASDSVICPGADVVLTPVPSPPGSYIWQKDGKTLKTSALSSPMTVTDSGDYSLEVNTGVCVLNSNTLHVSRSILSVNAGPDLKIEQGNAVEIKTTATGTVATYYWTPSGVAAVAKPVVSPSVTTEYMVEVTDVSGCTAFDTVLVTVVPPLFIPNAFTPNGDGIHDTWQIKGWEQFDEFTVEIFNRWGSIVYRSPRSYAPWNGTYKGDMMPVATYYYIITMTKNGQTESRSGSVLLTK